MWWNFNSSNIQPLLITQDYNAIRLLFFRKKRETSIHLFLKEQIMPLKYVFYTRGGYNRTGTVNGYNLRHNDCIVKFTRKEYS